MKNYMSMLSVNLVEKINSLKLKRQEVNTKFHKPFNIMAWLFMGSGVIITIIMLEMFFSIKSLSILYCTAIIGLLGSISLSFLLICLELPIKKYYNKTLGYNYLLNDVKNSLTSSINQK